MSAVQLALDLGVDLAPARPRLRLVPDLPPAPDLPILGDRRAARRLDPQARYGLEDGNAEVIIRGWGRQVTDVRVAGARL